MKAVRWHGKRDVRVETAEDPAILNPRDAIVRITTSAICGSDLHLYNGMIPALRAGDILGHECLGVVEECGSGVQHVRPGDRVVVACIVACGGCLYCRRALWSLCDNSNPNAEEAETLYGYSPSGVLGFSHIFGGYPGAQAERIRVPFADVGLLKLPDAIADDQAVFLADILPTAYMAVENCRLEKGDTLVVWGCGPVGLLAIQCARLFGPRQVIAVDRFPARLALAERLGARTLHYEETPDVVGALKELTGGRGPDACLDAVGMEAHEDSWLGAYDEVKTALRLETDRPYVLRQAIRACGKGGTLSIAGVYGGLIDKFPLGVAFAKGMTLRMGNVHVHRYMRPLLDALLNRELDPAVIVTDRLPLDEAPSAYARFSEKSDPCIKILLKP